MAAKPKYVAVEKFIEARSPIWIDRMRLGEWELEHVYLDSFFGDDGEEDFKVTACCEARWNYYMAKIKWFLPSAVRHDEDHLEQTLVHELCHVLLSAEQSVVDELSRVGGHEADALTELYASLRETSTELASRALWKAWGPALPAKSP